MYVMTQKYVDANVHLDTELGTLRHECVLCGTDFVKKQRVVIKRREMSKGKQSR